MTALGPPKPCPGTGKTTDLFLLGFRVTTPDGREPSAETPQSPAPLPLCFALLLLAPQPLFLEPLAAPGGARRSTAGKASRVTLMTVLEILC